MRDATCSPEHDLIRQAQAGSIQATEALLRQHAPHVRALLCSLRVARQDADDAKQAAAVGLLRALRNFKPSTGASLRTFAYNFMLGEVLDALYGREAIRKQGVRLVPLEIDEAIEDEAFAIAEARMDVDRIMVGLSGAEQQLIQRIFWEEASQAEIARDRGVHRVVVHRQLARALAKGGASLGEAVA